MDYSLPGSSVHGIFQARVLEWVAISFSRGSSQPWVSTSFTSHSQPFVLVMVSECVKVAQLCLTLCDPMDYAVHGILQARVLEWVAFPFSGASSQLRDRTQVSCIAGGFFTS